VRAPEDIHHKIATLLEGLRPGPRIVLDIYLVTGDLAKVEAILGQDIRAGRRLTAPEWKRLRELGNAATGGFAAASQACLAETPLAVSLGGDIYEARVSMGDDGRAALVRVAASPDTQAAQALPCGDVTVLGASAEGGHWRLFLARVTPAEP